MITVAIISEYNPFHSGHKYQIDKIVGNPQKMKSAAGGLWHTIPGSNRGEPQVAISGKR